MKRSSWWLVVGSWLAAGAAFGCVYRLGYLHGEIAAMVQADTAGTVGRGLRSAPQSQHNETALSGDCGGQGTARPTGATTDCVAEEVTR